MSIFLTLLLTGIGLGALYFVVGSGLSMIFGLLRVLNVGHAAFLILGAYAGRAVLEGTGPTTAGFVAALATAFVVGGVAGAVTEWLLIRPLYGHEVQQILATLGLSFLTLGIFAGWLGRDPLPFQTPQWVTNAVSVGPSRVPTIVFIIIVVSALLYVALEIFLAKTRYGLIVRAGVENRAMVTALGIDVRRAFTIVFSTGGAAAGVAGFLIGVFSRGVSPELGNSVLILGFVVVVVGGLGSVRGALAAGLLVGLVEQLGNYYLASSVGDLTVVIVMAIVLVARPQGLFGRGLMVGRT